MTRSCNPGRIARPAHSRAVDATTSSAHWAPNAATKSGQWRSSGEGPPASASTPAGATACQPSPIAVTMRSGCARPSATSIAALAASPPATTSGTTPRGSANSIGTKISCVGSADPAPTYSRTRAAAT